mmetsp:Transcript_23857/g.45437  ORF Transcript_23857/g.45437 Transcript_23857/m.45437 type:complete len:131 (-) Transcript_23857:18-410(-)
MQSIRHALSADLRVRAASVSLVERGGVPACAVGGPLSQQVRCRQWLFPNHASKCFRPNRFEHEGQALQFARESKRIPIWKLGWAANISSNFLNMVESGDAALMPRQRQELERLLGVPLKKRRRSRIDRTP